MAEYASYSDPELVNAIRENNTLAFKTLYFRYYEKLFYFVWFRIRNEELAKDIVQELFSRVWNNRSSLDASKSIKAYLYRIASNLVINNLQKQTVERKYLKELPPEKFVTTPNENFDLQEKIRQAINALPEKAQTVFILHRYEGFTYAEIARSLEISIKTVEKRMSHALRLLRDSLAPFR